MSAHVIYESRLELRRLLLGMARGAMDCFMQTLPTRRLQPFCSDCGSTEGLECDHSPEAWARKAAGKPIRLQDVDVVCGECNRRRGAARGVTTTRGRAPTEGNSRPLASPSLRLTPGNVSFDQFNGLPRHRGVVDGPRAGSLPAVENLERRTEIESHRIFVLFDVAVGEGDSESGSSHSASLP